MGKVILITGMRRLGKEEMIVWLLTETVSTDSHSWVERRILLYEFDMDGERGSREK